MTSDSSLDTSGMEDGDSCEFASSGTHGVFSFAQSGDGGGLLLVSAWPWVEVVNGDEIGDGHQ